MMAIDPRDIDILVVTPGPGKRRPETVWKVETRYRLVQMAARCFFPELTERQQGIRIAERHNEFRERGGWRWCRTEAVCPARYDGKLEAILFTMLKITDAPLSKGTAARALACIRAARRRG